jgi:hypothetical protein
VKNRSMRPTDFAAGTLRRGLRGPEDPPGTVAGTLSSGKTLRGRWSDSGLCVAAGPSAV